MYYPLNLVAYVSNKSHSNKFTLNKRTAKLRQRLPPYRYPHFSPKEHCD